MAETTLNVIVREGAGKQAAKRLRGEGRIPGVLYGLGMNPESLSIDKRDLFLLLHKFGRNSVVNLTFEDGDKSFKTFIYDIQHDPLSGDIIHIDLKQISLDEKINVTIPVHLNGTPDGVKNEGGIVEVLMYDIDINCLPTNIPANITLDIASMHLGDTIHVKDLPAGEYEFRADPENIVVHIISPKVVLVAEEEEGEEELEDDAAEPEVIGKSAAEGDGEE